VCLGIIVYLGTFLGIKWPQPEIPYYLLAAPFIPSTIGIVLIAPASRTLFPLVFSKYCPRWLKFSDAGFIVICALNFFYMNEKYPGGHTELADKYRLVSTFAMATYAICFSGYYAYNRREQEERAG